MKWREVALTQNAIREGLARAGLAARGPQKPRKVPAQMRTCVRTSKKIVIDARSPFKDGETRHQNVGDDTERWISPRRA